MKHFFNSILLVGFIFIQSICLFSKDESVDISDILKDDLNEKQQREFILKYQNAIVASTGKEIITLQELKDFLVRVQQSQAAKDKSISPTVYIEEKLREYLIVEDLEADSNIPKEQIDLIVESEIENRIKRDFDGDKMKFLRTLQFEGTSLKKIKEEERRKIYLSQKDRELRLRAMREITPEKVYKEYLQIKDKLNYDESYTVAQILYFAGASETDAQAFSKIKAVEKELKKNPENFAEAAKRISKDSYRNRGGLRDPLAVKDISSDVLNALKKTKKGEVTDVVIIEDSGIKNYLIYKNLDYFKGGQVPFEMVSQRIENNIFNEALNRLYMEYFIELRKKYYNRIFLNLSNDK